MNETQAATLLLLFAIACLVMLWAYHDAKMREDMDEFEDEVEQDTCTHTCTSDCRRDGCNCKCGEYHCEPEGECRYPGEECINHKRNAKDLH